MTFNNKNRFFSKSQILIGRKPLLELLSTSPEKLERIYMLHRAEGAEISKIISLAKEHSIPIFKVPLPKLQRTTNLNHQGVVGFLSLISFQHLDDLIPHLFSQGEKPLILILNEIEDVGNLGAMTRTAWLAGFHALVLPFTNTPLLQEQAIKASAGALLHIPICREKNFLITIQKLQHFGLKVVAASTQATNNISDLDFEAPTAIIMGNEQEGIAKEILNKCDHVFSIYQKRDFDSYNVSVAFGMIAYEFMKNS